MTTFLRQHWSLENADEDGGEETDFAMDEPIAPLSDEDAVLNEEVEALEALLETLDGVGIVSRKLALECDHVCGSNSNIMAFYGNKTATEKLTIAKEGIIDFIAAQIRRLIDYLVGLIAKFIDLNFDVTVSWAVYDNNIRSAEQAFNKGQHRDRMSAALKKEISMGLASKMAKFSDTEVASVASPLMAMHVEKIRNTISKTRFDKLVGDYLNDVVELANAITTKKLTGSVQSRATSSRDVIENSGLVKLYTEFKAAQAGIDYNKERANFRTLLDNPLTMFDGHIAAFKPILQTKNEFYKQVEETYNGFGKLKSSADELNSTWRHIEQNSGGDEYIKNLMNHLRQVSQYIKMVFDLMQFMRGFSASLVRVITVVMRSVKETCRDFKHKDDPMVKGEVMQTELAANLILSNL